ncbi:adult cuticle protein 1-like [Anopheles ziemanni]|uniref:adult cuticle protein 1-like n=1 Tax=Anopheles coustani TaxID=139045 RepID=UPI00265AEF33|nr:adult cuticle protein 1-like [Anopheles coustani]XP_058177486.1 adult cuticle protein 1-like [Anopheles ziemanni]
MKCIAAVVMMVLAVFGADAGLAPLLYSAPLALQTSHTTFIQSNPSAKLLASAPAPLAYASAPWAYGAGPFLYTAPLAYSAPALLYQKEARYLAANRGAIHEAPLPGHAFSQQQLNLDAAPGSD